MTLDEECKDCLFKSQMNKVEREEGDIAKLNEFKTGVKALCQDPPKAYSAPLLMRDIDRLHAKIFGHGIDYSKEKALFNGLLLNMENAIYMRVNASADPISEALKYAMAANFIDFARISDLDGNAVDYVIQTAQSAKIDAATLKIFKEKLKAAKKLCYLTDNCGEVVLDKILIRILKEHYPELKITAIGRGSDIINDVTVKDLLDVGIGGYAGVLSNGTNIPGTYLKEISEEARAVIGGADVIISKGLGNLETLYGEGYPAFYVFTCKCEHIAKRFKLSLWDTAFVYEFTKFQTFGDV